MERTTDEVVKLSSDLGVEFSEMIIPQYNSARDSNTEQQKVSDDIEKYFTSINSYLGEDVLRSPAFLKFFDEELMQFPLLSLQLDLMAKKVLIKIRLVVSLFYQRNTATIDLII